MSHLVPPTAAGNPEPVPYVLSTPYQTGLKPGSIPSHPTKTAAPVHPAPAAAVTAANAGPPHAYDRILRASPRLHPILRRFLTISLAFQLGYLLDLWSSLMTYQDPFLSLVSFVVFAVTVLLFPAEWILALLPLGLLMHLGANFIMMKVIEGDLALARFAKEDAEEAAREAEELRKWEEENRQAAHNAKAKSGAAHSLQLQVKGIKNFFQKKFSIGGGGDKADKANEKAEKAAAAAAAAAAKKSPAVTPPKALTVQSPSSVSQAHNVNINPLLSPVSTAGSSPASRTSTLATAAPSPTAAGSATTPIVAPTPTSAAAAAIAAASGGRPPILSPSTPSSTSRSVSISVMTPLHLHSSQQHHPQPPHARQSSHSQMHHPLPAHPNSFSHRPSNSQHPLSPMQQEFSQQHDDLSPGMMSPYSSADHDREVSVSRQSQQHHHDHPAHFAPSPAAAAAATAASASARSNTPSLVGSGGPSPSPSPSFAQSTPVVAPPPLTVVTPGTPATTSSMVAELATAVVLASSVGSDATILAATTSPSPVASSSATTATTTATTSASAPVDDEAALAATLAPGLLAGDYDEDEHEGGSILQRMRKLKRQVRNVQHLIDRVADLCEEAIIIWTWRDVKKTQRFVRGCLIMFFLAWYFSIRWLIVCGGVYLWSQHLFMLRQRIMSMEAEKSQLQVLQTMRKSYQSRQFRKLPQM